ncbi:hypothetical protein [Dokdonella sp.]|uniref:hypothetical protein n=1 Tax=Dokdonella sp. TaxID=2291710 RepID=UPI002F42F0AA
MNVLPGLVVWIAPLVLGSGLWAAATGWPRRRGALAIVLGGGWILGALSCGLLMRALCATDLSAGLSRVGTAAVAIGAAGWACAWWLRERTPPPAIASPATRGMRIAAVLILLVLAWRAWLFASDIVAHPTLPWDAWAVWQAKAKAWVSAGHASPYVPFARWILQPQLDLRTASAWSYPELLPWTMTWFAVDTGWLEPWINLAWLGLWAGLLAAHYGQWRVLGAAPIHALAGVYLLASLPLLDAHVALGGYADLWVAALMSLGGHAWLRWRAAREHRQLSIIAAAVVLLPMVKLEGAMWSIVLGVAVVFGALPTRMRSKRFFVGAAVAAFAIALCATLSLPWVEVARRYVHGGIVVDGGRVAESLDAFAHALWGQWNWNLLWFALPAALYWKRARWSQSTATRRMVVLVAVPLLLIGGLFAFTTASRYAQSYSAVNRLLLQLTPMLVSLLVLALWLPAEDHATERVPPEADASA